MIRLATPRPSLFPSLLLAIYCLIFLTDRHLADDNMTVFSTASSFESSSYQQNSSTYSTTTGYDPAFGNPITSTQASKNNNWCGKPRDASLRPNSDGSPALSSRPLLNLQCTPKLNPYVEVDDPSIGGIIVDAGLTYYPVEGAIEISDKVKELQIVIINTNTSQAITAGIVAVNTLGNQFQFPLTSMGKPNSESYQILCQAYSGDDYLTEQKVSFKYLPALAQKGIGESVRVNSESGTLMVTNDQGVLQTLLPFGIAIDYGNTYSASELTELINMLKELNVNTVQLILGPQSPASSSQLEGFLRDLGTAGMWVQYDMRNVYWNKELVNSYIDIARRHSNVLLYHTAMEPDGKSMEVGGVREISQTVQQNDPYHPVSLTLTCQDYQFSNYTSGNDIILTNPFVFGENQRSWGDGTASNSTFSSYTCDNCKGSFLDLVNQIRIFRDRRHALGRDRTMQIWGVPPASGPPNGNIVPTGEQFLLMCTIYVIEGAVGLMTWNDQLNFSPDLKMAIQTIGAALPQISRYLDRPQSFMPLPSVKTYPSDSFIANIWLNTADQTILVMVANLASKTAAWEVRPPPFIFNSSDPQLQASCLYISHNSHPPQILQSKDRFSLKGSLNPYGFGAWIIHAKSSGDNSTQILPPTQ